MNKLDVVQQKTLETLFKLTQEELLQVMYKFLQKKYKTIYKTENYIVAIGTIPIGIVAHMDTVFPKRPTEIFYDRVKNVMWSPQGLGADDRAGVFAITQIVNAGYRPTIILTTDEEIGGVGAFNTVKAFAKAPTKLKYIIELDRCNFNDCVFYECNNPEFENYVETFGFITNYGTFSDIGILCPDWEVAGVNLSIGYMDEHSAIERLYIGAMLSTIERVKKMLDDAENAQTFKYIPMYDDYKYGYSDYDSHYLYDKWYKQGKSEKCVICGVEDKAYNMVPVGEQMVCVDCVADESKVNWCNKCGEAFFPVRGTDKICLKCEAERINGR